MCLYVLNNFFEILGGPLGSAALMYQSLVQDCVLRLNATTVERCLK